MKKVNVPFTVFWLFVGGFTCRHIYLTYDLKVKINQYNNSIDEIKKKLINFNDDDKNQSKKIEKNN